MSEAFEWLEKYKVSRKEAELHQAWDLYYHVFKRINKQLHSISTLDLQYVAPALVRAQGMELAVPGEWWLLWCGKVWGGVDAGWTCSTLRPRWSGRRAWSCWCQVRGGSCSVGRCENVWRLIACAPYPNLTFLAP